MGVGSMASGCVFFVPYAHQSFAGPKVARMASLG